MNENIDLTKILKDCPKGTKLYTSNFGEVEFQQIGICNEYPIIVELKTGAFEAFTPDGKLFPNHNGECVLFPSKGQRDWSKFTIHWLKKERFDPKILNPFDRVLVRDSRDEKWRCEFFSYIRDYAAFPYVSIATGYKFCIPYNNDTKHLVGTIEEAPEYYRYWEN